MVNGPSEIWIERQGRLYETTVRFNDDSHLRRIINKMVAQVGRRVDESSPMVDARLPDGSRVNVIIPPLSLSGAAADDPEVLAEAADARRHAAPRHGVRERRHLPDELHQGRAQHPHLGRHGNRQDDAAERALGGDPGHRPDRHDRGRGRAPAPPAPRAPPRVAPEEHRGRGRDPDPGARPQLAPHAARPDHRRRGPRRRGARHAPGDEHRPRGIADDGARELPARRALARRDDGADGRSRSPGPARSGSRSRPRST